MKKIIPLVIISTAVLVSACSPSRWFGRGDEPQVSDYGAGIEIQELSTENEDALLNKPVADLETLPLEQATGSAQPVDGSGVVRYDIQGDTLTFLVTTDLDPDQKPYTVWVRGADADNLTMAFKLQAGKGGAWGTASVPVSRLPLEVVVASTEVKAEVVDQTVLKVVIPKPAAQ